jgi:hypothetical protein
MICLMHASTVVESLSDGQIRFGVIGGY